MSQHPVTSVASTDGASGTAPAPLVTAGLLVAGPEGYAAAGSLAWCAACAGWTEFVVPVGLTDADPDELACLLCGWAVLVSVGVRLPRGLHDPGTGRRAA